MSTENIRLGIIGGMAIITAIIYLLPGKHLKSTKKQGSSSSSSEIKNSIENGVKTSINLLASSSPIKFKKSKSSSLSFGGSRRKK
jgi:hypothetical protein